METSFYLSGQVSGLVLMNPLVKEFDYHPSYSDNRLKLKRA